MPPTRHRYWCIRQIAGDGRSETRSEASQGQIAYSSDNQSYRGPETRAQRDERDPSRDVLSASASNRRGRHCIAAPKSLPRGVYAVCTLQWRAGRKATRVINACSVLVLLTPWLCGQNPDELLVVRLPAKHGRINGPGVAPIPSPTVRGEIAGSGKDRRCGSMAAGRSSVGCCGRSPGQAAGEGKLSRHCAGREDKERTGLAPGPKFP